MNDFIPLDEKRRARLVKLESLDEKRVHTLEHMRIYHNRIKRAYGKKIKLKEFNVGDLVLKENLAKIRALDEEKPAKFSPNWIGPYVVTHKHNHGAYRLKDLEGEEVKLPINVMHLKRFYI